MARGSSPRPRRSSEIGRDQPRVGGQGIIPARDDDTFGVGYYYTSYQQNRIAGLLGIDDHAQGFEAYYDVAITPAAQLTFDVQVHDTALPDTDTAAVLGVRLNLSF